METCERCGAELGVGRFCLNCGHPVGEPVDPHDDFLPWLDEGAPVETSDGPTPEDWPEDAPVKWLPWVGGVAGLVVLAAVLVSCLGGDEELPEAEPMPRTSSPTSSPTSAPTSAPATEPATPPTPRAKPVSVAGQASVVAPETAPPTQDLDGELVAYDAPLMLDGIPATAWRMPGAGGGTTLTFTLAAPTEITRVGMINGYAKLVEGVDWYPNNRRVIGATWTFDDGSTVTQTFAMTPRMQTVKVPAVTTSTLELTINSVTAPGGGPLGRDYTVISEAQIIGRPAS